VTRGFFNLEYKIIYIQFSREEKMAKKKYYGSMGGGLANMPQEVKRSTYPKKGYGVMEGSYVDTQPELDREFNKAIGKVRRGRRK
jgi:hypothetical protein